MAKEISVGRSLVEESLTSTALRILKKAEKYSCEIILPIDLVVAKELSENIPTSVVASNKCPENFMILDAGPLTVDKIKKCISNAKTLLWNGPLGAFEINPFDQATSQAAKFASEKTKTTKKNEEIVNDPKFEGSDELLAIDDDLILDEEDDSSELDDELLEEDDQDTVPLEEITDVPSSESEEN